MKKWIAELLVAAMCITMFGGVGEAAAAAKPKLSKKSVTLTVGANKSLKVTKANGAKITWKSSKTKVAAVKKSGKYGAKVTAKAKGEAVITAKVKKGKKTYSLKCKVTVKKKKPSETAKPIESALPSGTPAAGTSAPGTNGTPKPSETAKPLQTALPSREPGILKAYEPIFGNVGTCLNYDAHQQLQDKETLTFVKKHFNSFTLENEMKPDALLGSREVTAITKDEALSRGYVIPDNYTEEIVPQINFDTVDKVLEIARDNGLRMRAHTLVWHSQTPSWFFTEDYADGKVVTPEIMDARLEFYVSTVMKHVMEKEQELTGAAGSIVYTWDVVNEYLHRSSWGKIWDTVYGNNGMEPSYVKKAFEVAYSMVKQYDVQDKVTLVYNDYDTYFNVDDVIALVNFINAGEEANICGGIGMQSHVDITRPTLQEYGAALDAFMATGLEVQITELDITINFDHEGETYRYKNKGETDADQAAFVGDFMKMIVEKQRNRNLNTSPKGITGLTIWGLYDDISWRAQCSPLLFGSGINDPKPSYEVFLAAAE